MTISITNRLGLYRWDSGSDEFSRAQMTASHDSLEANAAGFSEDVSRPTASLAYKGFFHFSGSDVLSYCNGTEWFEIGRPGTISTLDGTLSDGASPLVARADHKHDLVDGIITNAKLRDSSGLSVIGRTSNSSGDVADIVASTDGHVLRRSGSALGFGETATAGIANNAVTDGKIRQSGALSVMGRSTNSTGNVADISAGTDGHVLRRSGSALGFGTITGTSIANDAVTLGTHTSGNYVATVTAGSNITITGSGEGAAVTVAHQTFTTSTTTDASPDGVVVTDISVSNGHVVTKETYDLDNRYYTKSEIDAMIADLYGDGGSGGYKVTYSTSVPNDADGAANGSIWLQHE